MEQQGGCICKGIRYRLSAEPVRVTYCHCRFCQNVTGAAYAVEPIFMIEDFELTTGTPKSYPHTSEGSGKEIRIHFCDRCGTSLYYTFERFEGMMGIHAGSLDDPGFFECTAENSKHIFLDEARDGAIIPAGIPSYRQHATDNDGNPQEVTIYDHPHVLRR